jgi:hypothetical protein
MALQRFGEGQGLSCPAEGQAVTRTPPSATERHRATFTFFIFIFRTVTQDRGLVPSECALIDR